jgi:hypothetical protein
MIIFIPKSKRARKSREDFHLRSPISTMQTSNNKKSFFLSKYDFFVFVVVRTTAATTAPPAQARKFTTAAPTAGEGEDGSGLKAEGSEQFERDHRSYQRSRQGEFILTILGFCRDTLRAPVSLGSLTRKMEQKKTSARAGNFIHTVDEKAFIFARLHF